MLTIDALQYSIPTRERFLEWRKGEVDAVHCTVAIWEDSTETLREIGKWQARLAANSDLIVLARTMDDIHEAQRTQRTAVILGFQNVTPFEADLDLVEGFHEAGVRISQLTYNTMNAAGSGCWEADHNGLSRTYGVHLIREMNQAGMVVDVSHSNERTCFDAFEASDKPVAITHANPIDVVGTEVQLAVRNKSLDLLKAMAQQDGVIGLSMYPRIAPNGVNCSLDDFCDMVEWTVERIGIDHVGFGSDFYIGQQDEEILWWRQGRWSRTSMIALDGYQPFPEWFGQSTGFPVILQELRNRGFSETDVAKLAGGNWERLFRANWE
jgi:membrane dipeptidase